MKIAERSVQLLAWVTIVALTAPVLHTTWVSFSPDSFLMPPTQDWSLKWYQAFFSEHRWLDATLRSLGVAFAAGTISVMAATSAVLANRGQRRFMSAVLLSPAVTPPVAFGTSLLPWMYFTGLWGTNSGMVLVHATLGLPIAFLIVRALLPAELRELEAAARGLGANRWQVLTRITLPLLRPALAAALISVFVLSLNESLVSLFIATPHNETLPTVVWPQLRYSPSPLVAVSSVVTTVVGLGCLASVPWLLRARWERT